MNTYISIIFKIMDRFKKRPLLAPEASILVNGQRIRPLYKPGGYFIFTDLAPGQTVFEICSPVFIEETVTADIPEAGKGYVMNHLMLNPSKLYPFGGKVTTASGRIISGNAVLGNQQFHVVPVDGIEMMKIAEDKAGTGNSLVKLFAAVPERHLSIPGKYMIKDKDDAKKEFCLITQNADKDGNYPLEKEMLYSHNRGTPLVEVIECSTAKDGSFFTALPDLKSARASLDFLVLGPNGKNIRKTFEVEAYKENNLGDIKI